MIVAVVPAAGQSRRMGVQKQLLPFAGTTVIGHIVDELLRSRIDEVCIVAGHQADHLRQALEGRGVRIVANPDYERTDMLASIRCGLAAMPAACRAVLVALGDQPAITAELIDAMIDSFSNEGRRIVVPVHAGRRGHPLLLDRRYRSEILTGYDRVGLRGLLAAHGDDVFELPVSTSAVLSDIDYPEDYQRELARLSREDVPDGQGQ
ncbi:MAG: nucleotidyltransferase family protein [Thermoguttaceae bacterium]|jgi:molybdenum cofactor cytidylyltransferase